MYKKHYFILISLLLSTSLIGAMELNEAEYGASLLSEQDRINAEYEKTNKELVAANEEIVNTQLLIKELENINEEATIKEAQTYFAQTLQKREELQKLVDKIKEEKQNIEFLINETYGQEAVVPLPTVEPKPMTTPTPTVETKPKIVTKECALCMEDKETKEFTPLSCTHEFCTACLAGLTRTALKNKDLVTVKCPNPKCKKPLETNDVRQIINEKEFDEYTALATKQALDADKEIKRCPTPDCGYIFINDQNLKETITCPSCAKQYCSNCLFVHDQAVSCEQAEIDRKKTDDKSEEETEEWKKVHTKQCPQCGLHIERNEGCYYMQCTKCKHEFCWECLKHYPKHIHPEPTGHKMI